MYPFIHVSNENDLMRKQKKTFEINANIYLTLPFNLYIRKEISNTYTKYNCLCNCS